MTNIANWKDPPFLMGKSTISMAIFNSKLLVYQRVADMELTHRILVLGSPHFGTFLRFHPCPKSAQNLVGNHVRKTRVENTKRCPCFKRMRYPMLEIPFRTKNMSKSIKEQLKTEENPSNSVLQKLVGEWDSPKNGIIWFAPTTIGRGLSPN